MPEAIPIQGDKIAGRPGRARARDGKGAALHYAEALLVGLVVAFFLRAFIVQSFKIPSASMKPTLLVGDYVLVEKFTGRWRTPRRGDVIVFKYPHQDNEFAVGKWLREFYDLVVHRRRVPRRVYVKRVVAGPGDAVWGKDGVVFVNGCRWGPASAAVGAFGPFKVPRDSYFVMGDNYAESRDSRHWGFVARRLILGRAVLIYWSTIPASCPKHNSPVERLYPLRSRGGPNAERVVRYLCEAGGEVLIDGEDVRLCRPYEFWRRVRGRRIFTLIE